MILGIDASNIRGGGGVTYLAEMLRSAQPHAFGFKKIVIWSGYSTLRRIEDRPWLHKIHEPLLDRSLPYRLFWQFCQLSLKVKACQCNMLYVPGSFYLGRFRPFVTISRNMLPFELREMRRYGVSRNMLRLLFLRWAQLYTFRRTDGLIFLTRYARNTILRINPKASSKMAVISHGIDSRFQMVPRKQLEITRFSTSHPLRIIYVSAIDAYKHQWHVAKAISKLRKAGFPLVLDLIGPAYNPSLRRLRDTLQRIDPEGEFIRYLGAVSHDRLPGVYSDADVCVFASSCENMPNILLEAMASGLPIACSNRGPMPEVLGDAGLYFDPENPEEIANALSQLINSPELRTEKARASFALGKAYSWRRCADETFHFLSDVMITSQSAGSRVETR